jgi:predicted ATPase with chaperone activity
MSMLARRLTTILPDMTLPEAIAPASTASLALPAIARR